MHMSYYVGKVTKTMVLSEVSASPCFAVMIDETMDITTKEQMVVYVKFMTTEKPAKLQTEFLGIVEVGGYIFQHFLFAFYPLFKTVIEMC